MMFFTSSKYHLKYVLLLFFILLSASYSLTFAQGTDFQQQGWTWQYPKPQGNTLNDIFIFNRDTAIAVGDIGVVLKTTNGGKDWDVISNACGTSYNLNSVHFIDEQNGWAAGLASQTNPSDGNILIKTSDGGTNWSEVKVNTTLPLRSVYFVDADTGIVVGEDGIILRTTDGGKSWNTKLIDDYIKQGAFLDVFHLNKIVLTDKMNGWIVGYGYYGNQLFRTTDCGRTWTWNEGMLSPKIFKSFNDISFAGKNNIYVVGGYGAFLKSTDGGASWKYLNLYTKYKNITYQFLYSVCFTDSLNGFITGGDYYSLILKTTDGGENWKELDSAKHYSPLLKVKFSDKSNGWMVGYKGMLFRSTDEGSSWVSHLEGANDWLTSVYFSDESNGWAVGEKGKIVHTTDKGKSWTQQRSMTSGWLYDVCFSSKTNGWIAGDIDSVETAGGLRTTDGGFNWIPQTNVAGGIKSIYFANADTGWMVGNLGRILKTTDSGGNWQFKESNTKEDLSSCSFINSKVGWAAGYKGTIRKTTDGGESWSKVSFDSTIWLNSVCFVNEKTGWVAGEYNTNTSGSLFKTEDGGLSWNVVQIPESGSLSSVFFTDENNGWIAGWNLYIGAILAKTSDGGKSWVKQLCPSTGALSKLFFLDKNIGFLSGHGLSKTTNGGMLVSVEGNLNNKSGDFPEQFTLYQNFPNPFNPSTTISYGLAKQSNVEIKIYNIIGNEVRSFSLNSQSAGFHNLQWDGRNSNNEQVTSGIYIYRLRAVSYEDGKVFEKSAKMMLVK